MEPTIMAETKQNVSDGSLVSSSQSSLKRLEQQQSNGNIAMKGRELEFGNASSNQESSQINDVTNSVDHKDKDSTTKPKKRSSRRKKENQTPKSLSDSGSSLTSLTSSSDDSDDVVERFVEKNVKNENASTPQPIKTNPSGHHGNEEGIHESSEVKDLKQKLQEALTECETAKDEAKASQKQRVELEERLSNANKENEELQSKTENLKKIKNELNDQNDLVLKNNSSVIEERDGTIQSLRAEIASLQESKDATENELQITREGLTNSVSADHQDRVDLPDSLKEFKSKADNQEQEIADLKDQLEMAKKEMESKEKEINEMEQLREELESAKSKGESQDQEIGTLKDQLEMTRKEIESKGKDGSEVEMQLREDLVNAKTTIRSINQSNSKLEAKLSNSQTLIETGEVEFQKLKEEIKALKDKIKWLERRRAEEKEVTSKVTIPRSEASTREDLDRKLHQESQRRSLERIRELEQKVIQVNEEKQKLKLDYDEAVKALEAVEKVYSVREMALQQYKTDLEDANNSIKQQSCEILQLKMGNDQMKKESEKAEKRKIEHEEIKEELKDDLTRTKETVSIYKTEIEEVRKEIRDQIHELQMSQAKARERGKRIQILELELKETKETLQISENVIDEKQKNMNSLQESLQNEKKNCKNLEQELEEMFYLKKKMELIEDEKARVVEKLRGTESDLKEAREALENSNQKIKDLDREFESLRNDHKTLLDKCEDQDYQIHTLRDVVDSKEGDIEQQLIEIIHSKEQLDDLTLQLQDIWASYSADKALWKHTTQGRSIRRRPHSASAKKVPKAPTYQSPPTSKPHSLCHRRLVNKLGEPVINQNYINSTHKSLPANEPQQTTQEAQTQVDGTPDNKTPILELDEDEDAPTLSPRPPNGTKPRPLSSYGIKTYPPSGGARNGDINGYNGGTKLEDLWMYKDDSNGGDSDEQIVQLLVNTGDRVLIQSKVVGDELLNVSGIVKFVGKVGKKGNSPVYVGLKLDQPFGDNNGVVKGKQIFKCQPKHGKLIKMSDIHAVMHPRTQNYKRVKATTANW